MPVIVSHTHRFIFFAVPKTGSQSVRAALRPHLDPGRDWEQANWGLTVRLPIPELARVGHGHLRVDEAKPRLDDTVWRTYFKFAFVRNPWDRFISAAFFLNRRTPVIGAHPTTDLARLVDSPRFREDLYFRPQCSFIDDADGSIAVDFVGRLERLPQDLHAVCREVGLPPVDVPHLHRSAHAPAASYYDDALREKIGGAYARDIEQFGYTFPWPQAAGGRA